METAAIVAEKLGIPKGKIVTDSRLSEINFGVYNKRPFEEYKSFFRNYGEHFDVAPENGESQADVLARTTSFIMDVDSRYEGKNILVVTHDSPAWLLASTAKGLDKKSAIEYRADKLYFLSNAEYVPVEYLPLPRNEKGEIDLHRPFIDDVAFPCACGGVFKRIPDVFDCWFESGSMPYAQHGYPHAHDKDFDPKGLPLIGHAKGYPADFIAEGLDQTRGWFYTLIVLGTALFGKAPYKNVVVNGLLVAEDGRKMSKRLKNYPDLSYVIDKYGADALRYFLMSSPVVHAEDSSFTEKGVDEVYKKLVLRLENTVSFYELYKDAAPTDAKSDSVLDRWIMVRLAETAALMTKSLENYEIDRGAWPLESFIDDLSTWYVRRSRERLKGEDAADKAAALSTFRSALFGFSKIMAPYMPFLAEHVHSKVRRDTDAESVHLESWPEVSKLSSSDEKLLADMAATRKAVTLGLEARVKAKMNVRQPLAKLMLKAELGPEFRELVKDEVNVKSVDTDPAMEGEALLDTVLTAELKAEGQYREIFRAVQDLRKKSDLNPSDRVGLSIGTDAAGEALVRAWEGELKRAAGITAVTFRETQGEAVKAGELSFTIAILK
jgi:isoleucyl-tRNA synthetase